MSSYCPYSCWGSGCTCFRNGLGYEWGGGLQTTAQRQGEYRYQCLLSSISYVWFVVMITTSHPLYPPAVHVSYLTSCFSQDVGIFLLWCCLSSRGGVTRGTSPSCLLGGHGWGGPVLICL